jgi:hypothetical protein
LEFQTSGPSLRKYELKEEKILSSFQSLTLKIGKSRPWNSKLGRAKRKKTLNAPNFDAKVWIAKSFFFLSALPSSWLSYGEPR